MPSLPNTRTRLGGCRARLRPTRPSPQRRPLKRAPASPVFATPDGDFIYVANQGTEREPDNTVSVIDTCRNVVVKTLTTDRGAHGVVVSVDGSRSGPGGITYRPVLR